MGEALEDYHTELLSMDKIEHYWPMLSKQLDTVPHVWDQWYTKEYIRAAALSGEFDVWCVGPESKIHLVLFTKVLIYPNARVLHLCFALGHDLKNCLPSLMATLEKVANSLDCQRCEVIGRKGWKKFLPGFKETGVVLTKNLEHFKVQ